MFAAFHILNQFDIPKGSVINSAVGEPTAEITEWTSVADLKNLRWYFRTREDQSIRMVDLKQAVDAAKGEIATIEMEASRQPYTNVSGRSQEARQAAELETRKASRLRRAVANGSARAADWKAPGNPSGPFACPPRNLNSAGLLSRGSADRLIRRGRHPLSANRASCYAGEPAARRTKMPPRSPFPLLTTPSDSRTATLQGLLIGAIVIAGLYVAPRGAAAARARHSVELRAHPAAAHAAQDQGAARARGRPSSSPSPSASSSRSAG